MSPAALPTRASLGVAALLALAVAGCAGDAGGGADAGLAVIRNAPLSAPQRHARAVAPAAARSTDPVRSTRRASRARFPAAPDDEGDAEAFDPCTLVTRGEARAVLRRAVAVRTALQGPTCLYRARGSRAFVAVAVQPAAPRAVRRHGRRLATRRLGGRVALCVRYGGVATYVALGHGRVLQVTAPCSTGAAFAARALARLRG